MSNFIKKAIALFLMLALIISIIPSPHVVIIHGVPDFMNEGSHRVSSDEPQEEYYLYGEYYTVNEHYHSEEYNLMNEYDSPEDDFLLQEELFPITPASGFLHPVSTGAGLTLAWDTPGDITIQLTDSFQMDGQLTIAAGRHVTIISDGGSHTLTSANNARHFNIAANGTLSLGVEHSPGAPGNNFTLQGQGVVNGGGGSIIVSGSVSGNTGSTLNMYGGTITGATNAGGTGGGAIHLAAASVFNMYGGTIDNNISDTASSGGGGAVNLSSTSVFNMYGGTLSNNIATIGGGGAVGAPTNATVGVTFNMYGGQIIGNRTDATHENHGGGGVFLQGTGSVFAMHSGAVISNNTARIGGGVRLRPNNSSAPSHVHFHMHGGEISGNNSTATGTSGGGVHLAPPVSGAIPTVFVMESGAIHSNIAVGNGGGIANSSGSNGGIIFDMRGGEIYDNQSGGTQGGGGVYLQGTRSVLTLHNGAVIRNNSADLGGGIRINVAIEPTGDAVGAIVNLNGGAVYANTAISNGGGIHMSGFSAVNVNSGQIRSNSAGGRGGGVLISAGAFALNGGAIEHNIAGTLGGGVSLNAGTGSINMLGGTISNNQAASGGGVGFNIPTTMDYNNFIPFFERVTIDSSVIFSENTATSGESVNDILRNIFVGDINVNAFNNNDIHTPSSGAAVSFITFDNNGNEILLHEIRVLPNSRFTDASEFPTPEEIREETQYYLWENEYSTGFDEWIFTNQWRANDPVAGQLVNLSSLNMAVPAQGLRFYAQIPQLLIVNDETLREAISRTTPNIPAVLVMQNDFDATQNASVIIPDGHDITITGRDSTNYTYFRNRGTTGHNVFDQRHIIVETGATLRLNNVTIQGNLPATNTFHGGVLVEEGAALYVNEGTVIENNRAIYGGGIFLRVPMPAVSGDPTTQPQTGGGGTVAINGATIRNNRATHFGGGICATGFTIDHPVFATTPRPSEQINTLTIGGNTRIHDNFAQYAGGGVMVAHFANCIIENVEIYNNDTRGWGGGIRFHNGGSVTMRDGAIRNNTANYGGGGIAGGGGVGGGYNFEVMPGTAEFNMYGGAIFHNNVTGAVDPGYAYSSFLGGGGIMVDGLVTFTMNGGEIFENSVPVARVASVPFGENPFGMGGGVFLNHGATFVINDGTIRDNQAYRGGGIHVATIENNAYHRTWLHAHNASVTGNTATENGGGIFATHYTNIDISDQVIFNNNRAVSLHSFFMYPTFGNTFVVSAGTHSGEGQGGYAGVNVDWATVSVPGTHALNNYDINFIFSESPPTKFLRVVFNPNGGDFTGYDQLPIRLVEFYGTYAPAFDASDNIVNPDLPKPTRNGYTFGGWFNTEAEANNLASQTGRILYSHSISNVDMRMLWARWIPIPGYTPEPGQTPEQNLPPNQVGPPISVSNQNREQTPELTGPESVISQPFYYIPSDVYLTSPPPGQVYLPPPLSDTEEPVTGTTESPEMDISPETPATTEEKKTTTEKRNPQTGDDFDMFRAAMLSVLFILSSVISLAVVKRRRR